MMILIDIVLALDKKFNKLTLSVKFSKLHCSAIAPASSAENQSKIAVSLFNKCMKKNIFFNFFLSFRHFFYYAQHGLALCLVIINICKANLLFNKSCLLDFCSSKILDEDFQN